MSTLLTAQFVSCIARCLAEYFVRRLQRAIEPNTRSMNVDGGVGENIGFFVYIAYRGVREH